MFEDFSRLTAEGWAIAQLLVVTAVVMWVAGVRACLREANRSVRLNEVDHE